MVGHKKFSGVFIKIFHRALSSKPSLKNVIQSNSAC